MDSLGFCDPIDPPFPLQGESIATMTLPQIEAGLGDQRVRKCELGECCDRELADAEHADTELRNAGDAARELADGNLPRATTAVRWGLNLNKMWIEGRPAMVILDLYSYPKPSQLGRAG